MQTLNDQQRTTLLDRLFRRISKLDNQQLLELDRLTGREVDQLTGREADRLTRPDAANTTGKLTSTRAPALDQRSRRYFLATLAAGSLLAAAAGGAAAVALSDDQVRRWLAEQGWLPTQTPNLPAVGPTATLSLPHDPTLPAALRNQIIDLQNQIVALTAERDNLSKQVADLGGQVKSANGQITDLSAKNSGLQELITLFNQLEATNLDQTITSSLQALGVPVLAVYTIRMALDAGVALAARVLQTIEDQMPLLAAGLDWLDKQMAGLTAGVRAIQTGLAISGNTPAGQAMKDFTNQVLDMLPFGTGQNVKVVLSAIGDVLNRIPDLINNVNVMLLGPARAWIVPGKQGGLNDLLLRPVREQVLTPAQQMVANAENLNTIYNTKVAQPVQSVLDQRAQIRAEILKKAGALPG